MTPADSSTIVQLPRRPGGWATWNRILDAGVALLEDSGYESFTIAEICKRAEVAPPTLYQRVKSKDALFLAVYEHGVARLRRDQEVFQDDKQWEVLPPAEAVRTAVTELIRILEKHGAFLRAVVGVSLTDPEVRRRGSVYGRELGERFAKRVMIASEVISHPDPLEAAYSCFTMVHSATIMRMVYGADFATPRPVDDSTFMARLSDGAIRYLLADWAFPGTPAGAVVRPSSTGIEPPTATDGSVGTSPSAHRVE